MCFVTSGGVHLRIVRSIETHEGIMRFIRKLPTAERVGYHPVHVMRKANDPNDDFPAAVKIGPNAIGFVEEEIEDWMQRRIDERPVSAAKDVA